MFCLVRYIHIYCKYYMSDGVINENSVERWVIDTLRGMGYEHVSGADLLNSGERTADGVLLEDRMLRALRRINPDIPDENLKEVISSVRRLGVGVGGTDAVCGANGDFFSLLWNGVKTEVADGAERRSRLVRLIDFEDVGANEFLVVDQFSVQVADGTEHTRRADVVLFVNGMPVIVFELKNPADERATLHAAYTQITETYMTDIPSLFVYNHALIVSDGTDARFGVLGAPFELFTEWKKIESEDDPDSSGIDPLVRGMCDRVRLLDIMRYFTIFDNGVKKVCRYHQYYGVNNAVASVRHSVKSDSKRAGVFWHTQGSGKTLSMIFLTKKLQRMLTPFTVVFVTDRRDLDGQSYGAFSSSGFDRIAHNASDRKNLSSLLREGGSRVVFSTIQLFEEDAGMINDSHNILVIADEAHRSQYGEYGARIREALPKASFFGITGTPIYFGDKHTNNTFGDCVSRYTIDRAVADGVVVNIYYAPRFSPVGLKPLIDQFSDEECEELDDGKRAPRMNDLLGSEERVARIAEDIVNHYIGREVEGKALVAVATRDIAFRLCTEMRKVDGAPEIGLVLSSFDGFDGEFPNVKDVERRFKTVDDPLKIAVVCDMWLTGFDVPHLHTLYIDKPLKNHTLLQAIARVNRVFRNKVGGLVIDYIGISGNLKESLAAYSERDMEHGFIPLDNLEEKMLAKYRDILEFCGTDTIDCSGDIEVFQRYYNSIVTDTGNGRIDTKRREEFLNTVLVFIKAYQLLLPHNERARSMRKEAADIQKLAVTVRKNMGDRQSTPEERGTVDDINRYITAESIIPLFGNELNSTRAISILDEQFIRKVEREVTGNALIDHIAAIMREDLKILMRKNPILAEGIIQKIEELLRRYEDGAISSAEVMSYLVEWSKEMETDRRGTDGLDLNDEQYAIYTALLKGGKKIPNDEIKRHIDNIIRIVKNDIMIDWLSNENIKSRVRKVMRDYLLDLQFEWDDANETTGNLFKQIEVIYGDYCPANR